MNFYIPESECFFLLKVKKEKLLLGFPREC